VIEKVDGRRGLEFSDVQQHLNGMREVGIFCPDVLDHLY
jgi:hypothetical protein